MDAQLKSRELCVKNKVPEKEIFKLMTLRKVCELIADLSQIKPVETPSNEEIYKLRQRIRRLEDKGVKNYELSMEVQKLKRENSKLLAGANKEREKFVDGLRKENLEYRTRNEKLIDEVGSLKVKIADLKAKKMAIEEDYRLDKKRLKNLLKMGDSVELAEVKSYKREIQQLKSTLATLRRGTESRDKRIKAQTQELRIRATEITKLKKAISTSILRKRK